MRSKYSTAAATALFAAALAAAEPCPPSLATIANHVAALRHVAAPFLPPCRFISPDSLRDELDVKLRRDLPLPPERYIESLWRLGLIDHEPDLVYPRLLDFYASQVLGYYEPAKDEMVLLRQANPASVSSGPVWAHELAHAAQERRFALPTRLLAMRDDGDRQRATSAIAEGDAVLVMLVLTQGGKDLGTLRKSQRQLAAGAETLTPPPGVPDFFVKELVFPYSQGFSTVLAAFERDGWPAVDRLLADPPATTAQLLHPDRTSPPTHLGDESLPPTPEGWTTVLADTLGEWTLASWLELGMAADEASRLAAGWDGDRAKLILRPDGTWALALAVHCRDHLAAANLAAAFARHLPNLLVNLNSGTHPTIHQELAGTTISVTADWPALRHLPPSPS